MTYVKGEQVRLKSGGPVMTINSFSQSETEDGQVVYNIRCHWFSKETLKQGVFNHEELEKA